MNRTTPLLRVLITVAMLTTASTFGAHHASGEKAKTNPIDACWIKGSRTEIGDWTFEGHWNNNDGQMVDFRGTCTVGATSSNSFGGRCVNTLTEQSFGNTWSITDGETTRNNGRGEFSRTVTSCEELDNGHFLTVESGSNDTWDFESRYVITPDFTIFLSQRRPAGTDGAFWPFITRWNTRVK